MEISFLNKVILVTGAGRGIGKEISKRLHKYKARVIAVSDNKKELDELQVECNCNIQKIHVNLDNWKETRHALRCVRKLDGLVNDAGIVISKPFADQTELDFDHQFNTNFKAAFNVTQMLLPYMKSGGSIVNLSSKAAYRASPGLSVYCATKAAIDSLTRTIAFEYGSKNIRANSICPTVALTKLGKALFTDPKMYDIMKDRIPLKRFVELPELADLVVFLLSDKSSFITGHTVHIDGGFSIW